MIPEFLAKLREVREKDPRYTRQAYLFAFDALNYTLRVKMALTPEQLTELDEEQRHISARQLLEGMRDYAVDQFGYLARQVWESWGIYTTADWGNIIYNLIQAELMRASKNDSISDFTGVFEFDEAFDQAWTWR